MHDVSFHLLDEDTAIRVAFNGELLGELATNNLVTMLNDPRVDSTAFVIRQLIGDYVASLKSAQ